MRRCPNCQRPYLANTVFCEGCGASLRTSEEDEQTDKPANGPGSGPLRAIIFDVMPDGRSIELQVGSEALILGRADQSMGLTPALDLTMDGGVEAGVSRRHARLISKGGRIFLEDLDSVNGTWLNETPLPPRQPAPLQHGDSVRLGRLTLRVRLMAQR